MPSSLLMVPAQGFGLSAILRVRKRGEWLECNVGMYVQVYGGGNRWACVLFIFLSSPPRFGLNDWVGFHQLLGGVSHSVRLGWVPQIPRRKRDHSPPWKQGSRAKSEPN